MDFFLRHYHVFKYVFIFLVSTFIFSYIIVVINKEEEKVEVLAVRDDTLSATVRVDMTDEGDYQTLVVMNEAPMGVGMPINEIPGYQSDRLVHYPEEDNKVETGVTVFGVAPNDDYQYIRVSEEGYLLCAKVDGSVWKLTLTDKKAKELIKQKVEETTGLQVDLGVDLMDNNSLIIRKDAPLTEPSKESY